MATYTIYKNLEKPLSTEKYNVGVANKNNDVIDSELHKLELKKESQDNLLATKLELKEHAGNKNNPHNVTKSQIGLNNVENTSDLDKPVSIAQQLAIDESLFSANNYTDNKIAELINGAPETLDTLKEVADAIEENETIVAALDAAIGTKVNKSDILKNSKAVNENTSEGKLVDALVVKEVFQSVSDGKKEIASAITDKGVTTDATDTFEVMAENISMISNEADIEFPLNQNFNSSSLTNLGVYDLQVNFCYLYPKKVIIKSLYYSIGKTSPSITRNFYVRIYGKKDGRSMYIWQQIVPNSNTTRDVLMYEDLEIDMSGVEKVEYIQFYSPSITSDYLFGVNIIAEIELYI